jgi:hypothetical protein
VKISRNALCPCGSGKKFKNCHLGREHELPGYEPPKIAGALAQKPPIPKKVLQGSVALIILGALTLIFMGHADWGVAAGGGGLLFLLMIVLVRDPPPPKEDSSDPSGINFGK